MRVLKSSLIHLFWLSMLLLVLQEPALANKFETIGKGVSGTVQLKREHLQIIFASVGGVMLLFGVLSIIVPRNNSAMVNYTLWKQSAAIFFVLAIAAFLGVAYI